MEVDILFNLKIDLFHFHISWTFDLDVPIFFVWTRSFLLFQLSILKHEKEVISNAEKRASDEVRSLSERVQSLQVRILLLYFLYCTYFAYSYCLTLQASLSTIQSAEEVREVIYYQFIINVWLLSCFFTSFCMKILFDLNILGSKSCWEGKTRRIYKEIGGVFSFFLMITYY